MRKILIGTLLLLASGAAWSQEVPANFATQAVETTLQQFLATRNAAGMGLYQPSSGSKTQIEGFYSAGDDHLAQQGSPDYGFDFSTLRYDRFSDKLFMRGSFHYCFDREKERPWSDVMDPWFSIPYIYGNSIAKDYDKHRCGLTFDLYTAPLAGVVSVGVRTAYEVADISGLRDPRPRTGYLNWQVIPSVLISVGRHHVGLDLGYGYSKEKLSGLSTIQSYPNLYYYRMSGLDHMEGTVGAYTSFKRQFYGGRFLGDLSYNYVAPGFRALVSGGLEYGQLEAYGDKMQNPGSYNSFLYSAVADIQWQRGSFLHQWHLSGSIKDAGGDEHLQELVTETDPVTKVISQNWVTLYTFKNRYILGQTEAALDYTLFGGLSGTDYRWSVRAGVSYAAFKKECFLPYAEFSSKRLGFSAGGSFRLLEVRGHKLEIDILAQGGLPLKVTQGLLNDNQYTQEVLEADAAYYRKLRVGGSGNLTWTFPLNLGKAGWANGYVRLDGLYSRALPAGSLSHVGLTVGLFTF